MDQTAVNGKDYHGGTGTLVFEHGEQVKYITIDIIDDKDFEKDETFVVELTGTSEGAHLGHIKSAAVTIVNDDGKCRPLSSRFPFFCQARSERKVLGMGCMNTCTCRQLISQEICSLLRRGFNGETARKREN